MSRSAERPSSAGIFIHAPEPTNRHVFVDAEGEECIDLTFVEEALGITAEEGHGFARFEYGDTIGPENRYKIVRKLGWGVNSSVWMAFDEQEKKYVAIKALKGYATDLINKGITQELFALSRVSVLDANSSSGHCLRLIDHFTQPGKEEDGDHLCIVTDILGGDVRSLQKQGNKDNLTPLPLPLSKSILFHTLRGLAHIHRCGIVHTDLKQDNIMFDCRSLTTEELDAIIKADPPRRNAPEYSWHGIVQSAVTQPLPLPTHSEAMKRTYLIADFGSAQSSKEHTVDEITPYALRAPEVYLRGPWDEKVDIWTFGCLVFELTTNAPLFTHEPTTQLGVYLDADTAMLWQMMGFTGERFMPDQLEVSLRALKYFNEQCELRVQPPTFRTLFTECLRNYRNLEENDISSTVAFMERCLRLDPLNRLSAEELLLDPWWQGVD